jgi:quinolinate synthase
MFMAETAAILNPDKTVVIPEPSAGCPMADMITAGDLAALKEQHPGCTVICYVNSTAEVKALSDICCTSSNALSIVNKLPPDTGIIFVPDMHLGSWVAEKSGRKMVLWQGFCPTHARMTREMILSAKTGWPGCPVLIHPEAPKECRDLADEVLSTGGMCAYVRKSKAGGFIIATESGILHTLKKQGPDKRFHLVDSSIVCPNMKKCSVKKVLSALDGSGGMTVKVDPGVAANARKSLEKMLEMSA